MDLDTRQIFLSRKDYLAALISFRILLLYFVIAGLFICFWFVYLFLGRKWSKTEVRCEVKEIFYSFKKLVAKIWLIKWYTLKDWSVRQSCETSRYFESLNEVFAFTANG